METLLSILVCYGICNIVVYGSIFENLREKLKLFSPDFWGKLFSCMMCMPFWVGVILSIGSHITGYTQFSPFFSNGLENLYIAVFLDGCLLSGTTWLIHTFQEYFEE